MFSSKLQYKGSNSAQGGCKTVGTAFLSYLLNSAGKNLQVAPLSLRQPKKSLKPLEVLVKTVLHKCLCPVVLIKNDNFFSVTFILSVVMFDLSYKAFGKPRSEGERVPDPLTTIFRTEDSGITFASIKT